MANKHRSPLVPSLLPPDLARCAQVPFAADELVALARWLEDPAWPAGTMSIVVLEGYLTALITWPVELRPGAWMPPIWNDSGWRLPRPVSDNASYMDFVRLIGGFVHYLDAQLPDLPLPVASTARGSSARDGAAEVRWSIGFLTALTLWSSRQQWRSAAARRAVEIIGHTSCGRLQSSAAASGAAEQLRRAVRVLASERTSRGPLGPLPGGDTVSAQRRTIGRQRSPGN